MNIINMNEDEFLDMLAEKNIIKKTKKGYKSIWDLVVFRVEDDGAGVIHYCCHSIIDIKDLFASGKRIISVHNSKNPFEQQESK